MTGESEPRTSLVAPVLVGGGVLAAVSAGALVSFRVGGLLLGGLLGAAAVARLLLPVTAVGLLAVRRRWVDVVTLAALAVSVGVLAVTAPGT